MSFYIKKALNVLPCCFAIASGNPHYKYGAKLYKSIDCL